MRLDPIRGALTVCLLSSWFGLVGAVSARGQSAGPDLAEVMFETGIQFPQGTTFALTEPTLVFSLEADEREERLRKLAGPIQWRQFSRNHPNAATAVQMKSLKSEAGERLGYSVRSAYLVYATLEKLRDRDLLQASFGADKPEQASFEELTQEELEAVGVSMDAENAGLAKMYLSLLNQVQLQGVVEMQRVEQEDLVQVFWQLHPSFAGTKEVEDELKNQWAPIRRNNQGDAVFGKAQPYSGLGGYISISKTGVEEGQLLVQAQLVIHEPEGWFENPNYLRSKLPLSVQEGAKKFRRALGQ